VSAAEQNVIAPTQERPSRDFSLVDVCIDETERRAWFLFASSARADSRGR
jgi:hypothetical protein